MRKTWFYWVKTDPKLNWFEKCLLLMATPIAVVLMKFINVKPKIFDTQILIQPTEPEPAINFFKRPPVNLQMVDSKNSFK
jgi:hypothetical protein